ncbi:hypothetical protein QT990_24540 [Microcoleus sp. T3_B1]|uniref:hypothetical protein n=1 Tax=Microcoleus sp. T3_B1 TaxID=3055425 RepID=UPI002FD33BDE
MVLTGTQASTGVNTFWLEWVRRSPFFPKVRSPFSPNNQKCDRPYFPKVRSTLFSQITKRAIALIFPKRDRPSLVPNPSFAATLACVSQASRHL